MKIFRTAGLCFAIFFLYSQSVFALAVSEFVFITVPVQIQVNEVSKAITIESRNSNGVKEPIQETVDLKFTSSSGSGIFLGSTGKPVGTVMSKNTANRTFYYKDSKEGDFVLTIVATGRDSKQSFTVSQHVYIGVPMPKPIVVSPVPKPVATTVTKNQTKIEENTTASEATTTTLFVAEKHQSFLGKILSWPGKMLGFMRHLFVEG